MIRTRRTIPWVSYKSPPCSLVHITTRRKDGWHRWKTKHSAARELLYGRGQAVSPKEPGSKNTGVFPLQIRLLCSGHLFIRVTECSSVRKTGVKQTVLSWQKYNSLLCGLPALPHACIESQRAVIAAGRPPIIPEQSEHHGQRRRHWWVRQRVKESAKSCVVSGVWRKQQTGQAATV